jgi:homospermidine synthase
MWYGSRLSIEEARELAPYQNATGMQVTSAVLAAHGLGGREPAAGLRRGRRDGPRRRCLEVQRPYLGSDRGALHRLDAAVAPDQQLCRGSGRPSDPWQFTNFLAV